MEYARKIQSFQEIKRRIMTGDTWSNLSSESLPIDEQVNNWVEATGNIIVDLHVDMRTFGDQDGSMVSAVTYVAVYVSSKEFVDLEKYFRGEQSSSCGKRKTPEAEPHRIGPVVVPGALPAGITQEKIAAALAKAKDNVITREVHVSDEEKECQRELEAAEREAEQLANEMTAKNLPVRGVAPAITPPIEGETESPQKTKQSNPLAGIPSRR